MWNRSADLCLQDKELGPELGNEASLRVFKQGDEMARFALLTDYFM